MNPRSKLKYIFLSLFLSFIFLFVVLLLNKKIIFVATLNSKLPEVSKERQGFKYDFDKIMKEKFRTFTNNEIGFSIVYPNEADIQIFNNDQIESDYGNPTSEQIIGQLNIGLTDQQSPSADEIYDALIMDIIYFQNTHNKNLDTFIKQFYYNEPRSGNGTKFEKYLTINGVKVAKLDECCYAGGTRRYILETKNNKYFLEIVVFPPGKDSARFEAVANKMIDSLYLLN